MNPRVPSGPPATQRSNSSWRTGFLTASACLAMDLPAVSAEPASPGASALISSVMDEYCTDCHNAERKKGNLNFESLNLADIASHTQIWEKVARRLRARQMPPAGKDRPDEATYTSLLSWLEGSLDEVAALHPNPGR